MMPQQTFTQPEFAAQSSHLPEGRTRVARSPQRDLVICDDTEPAEHCEILVNWNEVIVREHGSKNGTWIASRRVTGQLPVNHGEVIRFGRVEACLELSALLAEDSTEHTTHLLRQQENWKEPVAAPFHAAVQPGTGRPAPVANDGGTVAVPVPPASSAPASLTPYLNAPRRITESLERLVQLYDAWGKLAPAAEWKQKLATFQQANKATEKKGAQP